MLKGKSIEFTSSLALILWGLWVASPWWDVFSRLPIHSFMASVASEGMWGGAMLIVGLAQCIVLFRGSVRVRRYMTVICMFVWITLAVAFLLGNPNTVGGVVYASNGIGQFIAFTNLSSEIKAHAYC